MDLLGGYGSGGSDGESDSEDAKPSAPKQPKVAKASVKGTDGAVSNGNRKVVDFSKLPIKRPLVLDSANIQDDEAPLQKAAEAENLRLQAGRSLLASLPAPKVTLGIDSSMDGSLRIDLSEVKASRAASKQADNQLSIIQTERGIMRGGKAAEIVDSGEVPQELHKHPMFHNDAQALPDTRPNAEELYQMRNMKFMTISGDDMKDPNWYMNNQISGGPGLHKGKTVATEMSMYEQQTWKKTTHADPSRVQKRKHQINWLANEAMEKEAELLDRAASSRLTKAQTSLKYGW